MGDTRTSRTGFTTNKCSFCGSGIRKYTCNKCGNKGEACSGCSSRTCTVTNPNYYLSCPLDGRTHYVGFSPKVGVYCYGEKREWYYYWAPDSKGYCSLCGDGITHGFVPVSTCDPDGTHWIRGDAPNCGYK